MEREAASAAYGALHEARPFHDGTFTSWQEKRSDTHPYHADSGVTFGVADRDVAPHDTFTTDENASPLRPDEEAGGDPVGDEA